MWSAFSELSTGSAVSSTSVQNIVKACQVGGSDDAFPYTVDKFMAGFITLFEDDKCVGCVWLCSSAPLAYVADAVFDPVVRHGVQV